MAGGAKTVTILFTDLVGSTELLQRAGDEQAQRIFKAHHRLLREAVEAHGGHEVKWLGDGLMVAFDSAADAVKCAIAMQQSSRRPDGGRAAGDPRRPQRRRGVRRGVRLLRHLRRYRAAPVRQGGAGRSSRAMSSCDCSRGAVATISTKDLGRSS